MGVGQWWRWAGASVALCALAATMVAACGASDDYSGIFDPPVDPPPGGSKWQGLELAGACGYAGVVYVPVDEICGGVDDPGYLTHLSTASFRAAAAVDDTLYAVDGSHLWVLDVADAAPARIRTIF